jgi:hypothetical protein
MAPESFPCENVSGMKHRKSKRPQTPRALKQKSGKDTAARASVFRYVRGVEFGLLQQFHDSVSDDALVAPLAFPPGKQGNITMKKDKNTQIPATVSVPLRFALPSATQVFVTGTFDDWSRTATPLSRNADGVWQATLLLSPGRYEFRLVVDGEWADAPGAEETVENEFGSRNAVLVVEATSGSAADEP